MPFPAAAALLGESPRALAYWVRRYRDLGPEGLHEEKRTGRPRRLTTAQQEEVRSLLRTSPEGSQRWTAKALAVWLDQEHSVQLGTRQCARLIQELGE